MGRPGLFNPPTHVCVGYETKLWCCAGKSLHDDSSGDEDDMDEDSMLAAAAAAAEQHEQKPRRRERLKSLFSSIGKRDSHAPDPKHAAAPEEPRLSARVSSHTLAASNMQLNQVSQDLVHMPQFAGHAS